MKNLLTLFILCSLTSSIYSQSNNVGIGTTAPDNSAVLDITAQDKGVLLPRMDSTHRKNIVNPKDGLILYDSTTYSFWFFRDTIWQEFHWEAADDLGNHLATQNIDMGGQSIINLVEPTFGSDATTKTYVDGSLIPLISDIASNSIDIVDNSNDVMNNLNLIDNHVINDSDLSTTNEIQTLSLSGQNLTLSSGNTVTLPAGGSDDLGNHIATQNLDMDGQKINNLDAPLSNGDAATKLYVDVHEDGDADDMNEIQILSISNDTLFLSNGGFTKLPESGGAFENNAGVVRNTGADTDDFVFGHDELPQNGDILSKNMFFFDESKGAIRAGSLLNSTDWSIDSIGFGSVGFGWNTKAKGLYSVAIGAKSNAISQHALAMGEDAVAAGIRSVSIGSNTWSTHNSVAIGNLSTATNQNSTAVGNDVHATGYRALALGWNNEALGEYSSSIGSNTYAEGDYSFAGGYQTDAIGDYSTALGYSTTAEAYGNTAIGQFNEGGGNDSTWIMTDPILEVGIGTSSGATENAMTILKDGTVSLKEYTFPNIDGTSNQIMQTDGSGNLSWEDKVGAFENNAGVVRNAGADTDDFVFGYDELPPNGGDLSENILFFDESKAALRAGRLSNSANWSTDSIGSYSIALGLNTKAKGFVSTALNGHNSASGSFSLATGAFTKAEGSQSFSTGFSTIASGDNSLSGGNFSVAQGENSLAYGSVSNASGDNSAAFGTHTLTSYNSVAMGRYNEGNGNDTSWVETNPLFEIGIGTSSSNRENAVTVLKDGTVSFKEFTFPNIDGTAEQVLRTDGAGMLSWANDINVFENNGGVVSNTGSNDDDFVFGRDSLPQNGESVTSKFFFFDEDKSAFRGGRVFNNANWSPDSLGENSFAYGLNSMAIGDNSIALGYNPIASGEYSTSFGFFNNSSGDNSTSFGKSTIASGGCSFSMGLNTIASGSNSFASGSQTKAIGTFSSSFGFKTNSSGIYATSFGSETNANGLSSSSFGINTKAESYANFAIGRFNVGNGTANIWIDTDPLFEIGNGTDTLNLSNAFTVYKNGTAEFSDSLHTGGNINIGTGIGSRIYLGNTMMQSGGPTILRMDTNIRPFSDDQYDLGSSGKRWKDIHATNGVIQTSDRRLKKDITPLSYGLSTLLKMNVVDYHWLKESSNDKKHLGLIAQELNELIPEVVEASEDSDQFMGVKYAELVPVLIKSIQEQQEIIKKLEQRLEAIEVDE